MISPHPILLGDPALLRRKLTGAQGLLKEYSDEFHQRWLADPATRGPLLVLPALVDEAYLPEARAVVQGAYRALATRETDDAVQFHTWCQCGVFLRQAVFFDWLASRGAWSAADVAEAAECFLGFGFKHAYMVSLSRCRASNNQNLSMALYCAIVGYLFGRKHASHSTGQFLFDFGLGRLPDLIGLFPGDGYGGEGSTYTSHVNTPLACWTAEFLRAVTGKDWLETPFRPNGTTLRKMIEMELRLLSPGGLLAPWDHYGWQPETNAAPFAYLARATGNPRYLSVIPNCVDRRTPGMLAWGADDPLWTLLWWPDNAAAYDDRALPAELFGWFLPKTGAALDDPRRKARLMQVWDFCADTVAAIGRIQCNPNHLMFDYAGEPVFQDGTQEGERDPWQYPAEKVFAALDAEERARYLTYRSSTGTNYDAMQGLVVGIAPGLLGGANAIVVDDEPWYWPARLVTGQPLAYESRAGRQAVAADCASFYQPRYDVTLARRTSLWSDAGFGVVLDTLRAGSAHKWTWQAYLRPDVHLTAPTARVQLPNGHHVLLAWQPVASVNPTMVEGFPRTEERRSYRLQLSQTGPTATFIVLIAPDADSAAVISADDTSVEVAINGHRHRLALPVPAGLPVTPDVHDLDDITVARDLQFPEIEQLLGPLPPSPVEALERALQAADWVALAAAALEIGRRGLTQFAPALREVLAREHAKPHATLYAPTETNRWRLKTTLIVALGQLRDHAAVPLLGKILAEGQDFYPVNSVAAQALGRIGGPAAQAALAPALKDSEHNTRVRSRYAVARRG